MMKQLIAAFAIVFISIAGEISAAAKTVPRAADRMNVFEAGAQPEFECGETPVTYTVKNYSEETVASGVSEYRNGKWVLCPGSLPVGHYMIEAAGIKDYFAVVKPHDQRRHNEGSPFAADCASTFLVDEEDIDAFAETIRLAGIPWIRDRVKWGIINPAEETYDFSFYDKYINAFADRGISITETFHSAPAHARNSDSVLPDDLNAAYSFAKAAGAHYDGRVNAWEIWNEPDISFTGSNETADKYAAVLKAMSVGFRDGSKDALISTAGFANVPGEYNDLLFSNDINKFFDIYNLHAHRNEDSSRKLWAYPMNAAAHSSFATVYSAYDKPVWTGEAGVFMETDDGTDLSWEQQKLAARYLVTSAIEGLANGENKHFWFIMPYYMEKGMSLGTFSSRNTPYAAYSAAAAITEALGNGVFCGTINCDGVSIYCFEDGDEYAAVVWSESETAVSLGIEGSTAVITDIVGAEHSIQASNESISFAAGPDPVYIRADGFTELIRVQMPEKNVRSPQLSEAERIVVLQKYPAAVSDDAKTDGYCLPAAGRTAVTVEVYNFNSSSQTVRLSVKSYGGWNIENGTNLLSVPGMGKERFTFYISLDGTPSGDAKYPVVIEGSTAEGRITRSVSYITVEDSNPPVVAKALPDFNTKPAWVPSMPVGAKCIRTASGSGICFTIQFNEDVGDKWCYPQLTFSEVQDYSDYNGIAVTVHADAAAAGSVFRMFAIEENGAQYFTSVGYILKAGEQVLKIPWSRFVWQGGTNDTALDTNSIAAVRAGINTSSAGSMTITLSSMGVYGNDCHIHGRIDEAASDGINTEAVLSPGTVPFIQDGAAVIIDGKEYPLSVSGTVAGGSATASAGIHNALVRIYDESGYAARSWFTLTADGYFRIQDGEFACDGTVCSYKTKIENAASDDRAVMMYIAGYDNNGAMVGIYKRPYIIKAGEARTVSLECNAAGASKIKVFSWQDKGMVPVRPPVEYNTGEAVQ